MSLCRSLLQASWLAGLSFLLVGFVSGEEKSSLAWREIAPLPDREGFAGMFAGVSREVLLAAGGANFPTAKPWEGGQKVWYDSIFLLNEPSGKWQKCQQKLPRPLGYGVSVSHGDALVIAGGESAAEGKPPQPRAEVYSLRWNGSEVVLRELPPLPRAVANSCGGLIGSTIYIAGGSTSASEALKTFWSLDLALPAEQQRWRELPAWPGPARMLAVSATRGEEFFLFSGANLTAGPEGKPVREYLTDAYAFHAERGWRKLASLPRSAVAAASPAWADEHQMFIFSGDDGKQVGVEPTQHRGFSAEILRYDFRQDRWLAPGTVPAPRVTVPLVAWRKAGFIISGEQRPGVRSPAVWSFSLPKE